MTRKQQRIYAILVVVLGIAVAAGLSLYALRDNVTFFYAPSDIVGEHPKQIDTARPFRLGGLVMYGTIEKDGAITRFVVTDNIDDITVEYEGVAPALFAEGKGVVAMGRMRPDGVFAADQLLAKHDENYMPPEVARALEKKHDAMGVSVTPDE